MQPAKKTRQEHLKWLEEIKKGLAQEINRHYKQATAVGSHKKVQKSNGQEAIQTRKDSRQTAFFSFFHSMAQYEKHLKVGEHGVQRNHHRRRCTIRVEKSMYTSAHKPADFRKIGNLQHWKYAHFHILGPSWSQTICFMSCLSSTDSSLSSYQSTAHDTDCFRLCSTSHKTSPLLFFRHW